MAHFFIDIYINIGVKGKITHPNIHEQVLMPNGTYNFGSRVPAIPTDIVKKAIQIGFCHVFEVKCSQYDIIGTGEVGMGNTTTAAACILAALGLKDVDSAVGSGAGLTPTALKRKKEVIRSALQHFNPDMYDSISILSMMGGLDISAMVGLYLGAAYYRIPIVVDGLISIAAALLAYRLQPLAREFMFPSHCSEEPGYRIASNELKLEPLLDLNMRLGEGSGCPIAMHVIELALAINNNMMSFNELQNMKNSGLL